MPGMEYGCPTPGCFSDQITYEPSMEQIEVGLYSLVQSSLLHFQALMNLSEHCEQTIVNNCTTSALTGYSWWTDRVGRNVTYWDGAKEPNAEGCACTDTNSCIHE